MPSARLKEGCSDRRATWGGAKVTARRMSGQSIGQVVMRNSLRRRKALVRSCACMRLESDTRTRMPVDVADDRLIGWTPNCNKECGNCRDGTGGSQGN